MTDQSGGVGLLQQAAPGVVDVGRGDPGGVGDPGLVAPVVVAVGRGLAFAVGGGDELAKGVVGEGLAAQWLGFGGLEVPAVPVEWQGRNPPSFTTSGLTALHSEERERNLSL